MAISQILLSLVKLFLMIIPGYILARAHIIDHHQSKGISSIILNITWPCLIVMSLQREFSKELCINMGILILVSLANVLVALLASTIIARRLKLEENLTYLMTFMLLFGNTCFMGLPVCNSLYGSEGTFYATLVDCVQAIFMFTAGMVLIERSTGKRIGRNFKDLLTPGFIAIFIGLVLFFAGITLPPIISGPIDTIGSATSPLGMIVVGYQLGQLSFKDIFGDIRIYVISGAKLVAIPLVFMLLFMIAFPEMNILTKTMIVQMAAPIASVSTIFTQQYDGDVGFATKSVLMSTLFSLLTLSAFAVLVEIV